MGSIYGPVEFELNTGASIPAVGLGTWASDPRLIGKSLELGYSHLDCANIYANQAEIGVALEEVFSSGNVKREDIWITSKLWCTDHDPEDVPKALEATLKDLKLDYLDLYLIHWPVSLKRNVKDLKNLKPEGFAPLDISATWRAMEKLVDSGQVKSIGVINFSSKKLENLLSTARILPAVNQVECNPLWQQKKLREFCKAKGIHLSGYSLFGSNATSVLKNSIVTEVAEKLGKTPAQVALRWGVQSGISVLPKNTNFERLRSNLQIFDFSIPDEEYQKLSNIEQKRGARGELWVNDSTSPYKSIQELWDEEN